MAAWNERLKALLDERGVNRAAVVKKLGMTKNRISQMEAGHEPRVSDAIKLCRFLGLSVEQVFGEIELDELQFVPEFQGSPWRAFALDRGRYRGRQSLKLRGPAERIEPEDHRGGAGWVPVLAPIAAGEPREAHDQGYPAEAAASLLKLPERR